MLLLVLVDTVGLVCDCVKIDQEVFGQVCWAFRGILRQCYACESLVLCSLTRG